jgi:hypothetical protein
MVAERAAASQGTSPRWTTASLCWRLVACAVALATLAPVLWLHWKIMGKSIAVMSWSVLFLSPAYGWTVPLWLALLASAVRAHRRVH